MRSRACSMDPCIELPDIWKSPGVMNISESCSNPVTVLRKFISGFGVRKLRGHGADGLEMFKEFGWLRL